MRERPLLTDIDRIAAARIAADRLRDLITQPSGRWNHFIDSGGGIVSELDKRALNERHRPESLGVTELSGHAVSAMSAVAPRKPRIAATSRRAGIHGVLREA